MSEQADLAGVRQVSKGAGILEHLDVGFGNLGAGQGDLFNGQEALPLPAVHQIPSGVFSQTGNVHADFSFLPRSPPYHI